MSKQTIGDLVREMERDYTSGTNTISKYVNENMYENICTIDAYLNYKHISGEFDSLGREKPFFNIVISASNIWYRATDIDRSNIKLTTQKQKKSMAAFLANIHLHKWMDYNYYGVFLNEWGKTLARYGSAVSKYVEKDGKLFASVVPWNRLIVDPISFEGNPVIEILEVTESELRKNSLYDQDVVDELCNALESRKTIDGRNKDNSSKYIRLYEVHGNFPKSMVTGQEKDEYIYEDRMFVISFVKSKNKRNQYDTFIVYTGLEDFPYEIDHLIKEDGQTLSYGAVRHLFQSQWMVNHNSKLIKDQLDLASKLFFQTADDTFLGNNALTNITTGDVLIHKPNMPLTQVNNNSHDVSSLQSYQTSWKVLGNEITGISESMLGNAAPSGTAWRQVEALLQESHDLFNLMRENKGLAIERHIKNRVLKFFKKSLNNDKEISATLQDYEINKIDSRYVKNHSAKETNRISKEKLLSGGDITEEEQSQLFSSIMSSSKEDMSELGNERFFKPSEINWKEEFEDLEEDVSVDATNENIDPDAMVTLNTLLKFIASKQGQPMSDDERIVFNKILMKSGTVSPIELSGKKSQPLPSQPVPTTNVATVGV